MSYRDSVDIIFVIYDHEHLHRSGRSIAGPLFTLILALPDHLLDN